MVVLILVRDDPPYTCRSGAEESGVSAEVVGEDMSHWRGTIQGPEGTPYAGGVFVVTMCDMKLTCFTDVGVQVDIILDGDYPYNPPKMKFDTKVWHPNVSSQTGAICLDILKSEWRFITFSSLHSGPVASIRALSHVVLE